MAAGKYSEIDFGNGWRTAALTLAGQRCPPLASNLCTQVDMTCVGEELKVTFNSALSRSPKIWSSVNSEKWKN